MKRVGTPRTRPHELWCRAEYRPYGLDVSLFKGLHDPLAAGDTVAYILEGKQIKACSNEPLRANVLATITVSSKGWIDLAQVKILGEKWAKANRKLCRSCGVYS